MSKDITFSLVWILTVIVAGICVSAGSMSDMLPFGLTMFSYLLIMALTFFIGIFFYDRNGTLGKDSNQFIW